MATALTGLRSHPLFLRKPRREVVKETFFKKNDRGFAVPFARGGKTYEQAKVTGRRSRSASHQFRGGVVKVPFDKLPQGIQRQYGYNPSKPVEVRKAIAVNPAKTPKPIRGQTSITLHQSLANDPTLPRMLVVLAGLQVSRWLLAWQSGPVKSPGLRAKRYNKNYSPKQRST